MNEASFLRVNGQTREYGAADFPETVAALVASVGIDANMVVAEINGEIVSRNDYETHRLAPGDKVELVRFVGGG